MLVGSVLVGSGLLALAGFSSPHGLRWRRCLSSRTLACRDDHDHGGAVWLLAPCAGRAVERHGNCGGHRLGYSCRPARLSPDAPLLPSIDEGGSKVRYLGKGEVMQATYDQRTDILYVQTKDLPSARQVLLDDARIVDYSALDEVVGIEFIGAGGGIDLSDVPFADAVTAAIAESGHSFSTLP